LRFRDSLPVSLADRPAARSGCRMNDCDTKRKSGAATLVRMGAKTSLAYEGTRYRLPKKKLIQTTLSAPSRWLKKLLSLVTFFAAAKKVTPPPGRRLLQKKPQ
jgi:hypothetical protein